MPINLPAGGSSAFFRPHHFSLSDLPALLIDRDVPSRRWKLTTGLTAQMQLEELTDHDMRVVWTCTHPEHVFEAGVHVATARGLGTFLDMRRGRW